VCDDQDDDWLHALGLNCDQDPNFGTMTTGQSFNSPDAAAWAVISQYGTYLDAGVPIWGPTEGEKFLLITSGSLPAPVGGTITMAPGETQNGISMANSNPDNQTTLPGNVNPVDGGNPAYTGCDGVNDCSNTLQAQWQLGEGPSIGAMDLLWFQFTVDVPIGTHGFEFDFAWFSSEYPEWVAPEIYNDVFLVWSNSSSYTGNVTFINDQPLTVTALQDAVHDLGYYGTDPELEGTGFDGNDLGGCFPQNPFGDNPCPTGGGTGWYLAMGSATPEESLTLTWMIFDMGDQILDTSAIIDNWRWDCEGCYPTADNNWCGVLPQ
jgi:hypothetical protein